MAVTDIIAGKVLSIEDLPINFEFHPSQKVKPIVPRQPLNYDPELLGKDFMRKDVKPLQVVSPDGPSFRVNGNKIEWQKFKMRIR
jgi:Cu2+-containing amine oxidase